MPRARKEIPSARSTRKRWDQNFLGIIQLGRIAQQSHPKIGTKKKKKLRKAKME